MIETRATEGPNNADCIGQAQLMQQMFNGDDLRGTAEALLLTTQTDPNNAGALLDLANILLLRGDRATGLLMQMEALKMQQNFVLQSGDDLKLLILKTPGDFMANTPVEFLIKDDGIHAEVLYIAPDLPYPTHIDADLVFVAISEMVANEACLEMARALLNVWGVPFINNPDEIPLLARDRACEIIDAVPGVYMPQNVVMSRDELKEIAGLQTRLTDFLAEQGFPLLVRPIDSHAGNGLAKLTSEEEMANYLNEHPDKRFYVSPFVDYASADGQYRKYRIVFIDREPFLCHMAISSHWMVHYLNAGMTECEEKRWEEARTMADFTSEMSQRHQQAFAEIVDRFDLEYFGIDCAETPDGRLLVFEVANAMVVHDMDPVSVFPYKKPVMEKVYQAFQKLLKRRMLQQTAKKRPSDSPVAA